MLIPVNKFILVQKVPTPTFSKVHTSYIVEKGYIFGRVLKGDDSVEGKTVLFPESVTVPCRWKEDGTISDFYLIEAEDVIAYLDPKQV